MAYKIKIDPEVVCAFAASGLTNAEIARALKCSRSTLARRIRTDQDVRDAIEAGRMMYYALLDMEFPESNGAPKDKGEFIMVL